MTITRDTIRDYAPVLGLIGLSLLIALFEPGFLSPSTQVVLLADTATLFIMAAGTTFVILLAGIDLSLQSMASLATVLTAILVARFGMAGFVMTVATGALLGALSGVAHTQLKIASFIATLAMGGVAAGAALLIAGPQSVSIPNEVHERCFGWIKGQTAGIPHEVIIGAVVLVVCTFLHRKTPFGRFIDAIGAGEPAALASGIRINRYKVAAFALSGALAALSGIVLAGRMSSGSPTMANEFLLPAIAAVIVGGTALTGGVGSIWRTLVGALLVSVARVGMTFVGVSAFSQQIVFGVVLIVAVAITIDRSKIPIVK